MNTDVVLDPSLAFASRNPSGLNATEEGLEPVVNGELDSGVSAPAEEAETPTARWPDRLASREPPGLNATGPVAPGENGEPETCVSAPTKLTENTDTSLAAGSAVASSPLFGLNATEAGPCRSRTASPQPGPRRCSPP